MLILGLGNPGEAYRSTRHNVGFDMVDRLASKWRIPLRAARHRSVVGEGKIQGVRVIVAKPQTYMNRSGEAAAFLLQEEGWSAEMMLVVHDEADLEPGWIRVKRGGGLSGHNGLRSIAACLQSPDFMRLRLGIGRPPSGSLPMEEHVLGTARGEERQRLENGISQAVLATEVILEKGIEAAMGQFNRKQPFSQADELPGNREG